MAGERNEIPGRMAGPVPQGADHPISEMLEDVRCYDVRVFTSMTAASSSTMCYRVRDSLTQPRIQKFG